MLIKHTYRVYGFFKITHLKFNFLKQNIYFFNKAANWAAAPLALTGAVTFGPSKALRPASEFEILEAIDPTKPPRLDSKFEIFETIEPTKLSSPCNEEDNRIDNGALSKPCL